MERRLFLTTLFKGVVASTVAYSLPIVGQEFSEVVTSRDMRVPLDLRPGGYLVASDILAIELARMRPRIASLFDYDDTFFKTIGKNNG